MRCYRKSQYLAGLGDGAIDTALAIAAVAPSDHALSCLWNFGGATAAVPAEEIALGERSMGWMYSLDSVWSDPSDDEANIAFTRTAWQETRKFSHEGRLYVNFAGHCEDGEGLVKDAYGTNHARLAAIKSRCDPGNLFRFNQNIRPTP